MEAYANGMMNGQGMTSNQSPGMSQAQSVLNWNPNQLDIRTKSVEKTLEPLVLQVRLIRMDPDLD